ncbi:hypothetical protein BJX63DRAFT_380013 [Aspergillus granulosus]|uniref:Uncharacterized protein n=1 Tax=Aspergillus granulosus TaxID=176169 RepID=A0ABR4HYX3_9EURO
MPIEVPKLEFLNGTLSVYGNSTAFRLGIEFNTGTHVIFKSAGHLWLWGNVGSIELPNIEHVGSLSIAYHDWLPCNETLVKLWSWVPEYDSDPYKCFEVDPEFLDDDNEEENTNDDTNDKDTDSSNDTHDDDTTETTSSTNTPTNDDQDSTDGSTDNSTGIVGDDSSDGSAGRIATHTGVAMLVVAVVSFCFY